MLRRFIASAALAAVAFTTVPSHAVTESATYVAGTFTIVGIPGSQQTGQRIGVGGWTFPGKSTSPKSIKLVDAAAPGTASAGIGIILCVDTCTAYQKGFCTSSTGVVSLANQGIPAGKSLRIGVSVVEPGGVWSGVGPCDGVGTAGTLTVTW